MDSLDKRFTTEKIECVFDVQALSQPLLPGPDFRGQESFKDITDVNFDVSVDDLDKY